MIPRNCLALVILIGVALPCRGELKPDEVAIVAAKGSRDSEALANYYSKVRNIPPENICLVDMPREETCPRDKWTWAIRPEIHKWLADHDPKEKIKCLVTVWDVPLRITPAAADASLNRYQDFLQAERQHRLNLLGDILDSFDMLVPPSECGSTWLYATKTPPSKMPSRFASTCKAESTKVWPSKATTIKTGRWPKNCSEIRRGCETFCPISSTSIG